MEPALRPLPDRVVRFAPRARDVVPGEPDDIREARAGAHRGVTIPALGRFAQSVLDVLCKLIDPAEIAQRPPNDLLHRIDFPRRTWAAIPEHRLTAYGPFECRGPFALKIENRCARALEPCLDGGVFDLACQHPRATEHRFDSLRPGPDRRHAGCLEAERARHARGLTGIERER